MKQYDIVEVVEGYSGHGSLLQSRLNCNEIISFNLSLQFGDLSTLKEYNRDWLKNVCINEDYDEEFNTLFKDKIDILRCAKKIRIWTSHSSVHDYLLMIYLCSVIDNPEIYVVFVDTDSKWRYSINCTTHDEIEELVKHEHKLTHEEKQQYINEWNKLLKENSDMRCFINKKVKSVSYDYFNDEILDKLRDNGPMKLIKLVGLIMSYDDSNHFGDLEYRYMINRLIDSGEIIVTQKVIKKNDWIIKIKA